MIPTLISVTLLSLSPKFNYFEPCLKYDKNRFQLRAILDLETLNTMLSGTNHIRAPSQLYAATQILEIQPLWLK